MARSILTCLILVICTVNQAHSQISRQISEEQFRIARETLVREVIIPGGVSDPRVIESSRTTKRHHFVDPEYRSKAYYDMALPIGDAQTISSPYIVAVMTEALAPEPTDRVLEIGTGSGYQAAILSPLVKEVYSIEIVESLGKNAAKVLEDLGYQNVFTKVGDGFLGWEEHAPFDKIIVTCSPEEIPKPLEEQLREGGLMIIPVGERYQQTLYSMRKRNGKLEKEALRPTLFVPMTGTAEDNRVNKPDPLNPKIINGDFEEPLVAKEHVPGWYYQFSMTVENDSDAPAGPQIVQFENDKPGRPGILLQGMPIDGGVIEEIELSFWVKTRNAKRGLALEDSPGLAVQFFDENRERISYALQGPFLGTRRKWKKIEKTIPVPRAAREAIISLGLFGGTGVASFDGVEMKVTRRRDK